MEQYVYRRKRIKNGRSVEDRLFTGRLKLAGDAKARIFALGVVDERAAEQKLNQLRQEIEQERAGIIAPKVQRDSATRSLLEHLKDFISSRETVGRDEKYISIVKKHIERLCRECKWSVPSSVTVDSFEKWRNTAALSPKTRNEYRGSVSALFNWMKRAGRVLVNPMDQVEKAQTRGRETMKRRAFTLEELARLVKESGPRGVVYLTAAYTGLRRGELEGVRWADLHLEGERPFVRARASTTKDGKDAVLPLHPEVVKALLHHKPAKFLPGDKVFAGLIPRMARMRMDMKAANIVSEDAKGEKADFHSLRKTCCTFHMLNGTSQRVTQELMRHADPKLTAGAYTDAGQLQTAEAVHGLPALDQAGTRTGTRETPWYEKKLTFESLRYLEQYGLEPADPESLVKHHELIGGMRDAGFEPATSCV